MALEVEGRVIHLTDLTFDLLHLQTVDLHRWMIKAVLSDVSIWLLASGILLSFI